MILKSTLLGIATATVIGLVSAGCTGTAPQATVPAGAPVAAGTQAPVYTTWDAVLSAAGRALIFRTSWVFAARGHNFVKTILRLAGEGKALRIVDDQIGAPTPAALIADVSAQILAATQRGTRIEDARLYHLTAAAVDPTTHCPHIVAASATCAAMP